MRKSSRTIKKKAITPEPSEESQSQEQSEEESCNMCEPAIKTLQFRKKRGEKMTMLINKKVAGEDEDDFWKSNPYFGDNSNLNDEEDQEEYLQSSSGRDQFDSDFLSSQSQKGEEKQEPEEEVYVSQEDEGGLKQKRKLPLPLKAPMKKVKPNTIPSKAPTLRYIHQEFSQSQLLAEAAHTEYYNYLSLQKLISLEEDRKIYNKRHYEISPPKIVFRNKVQDHKSTTTYTLVGFEKDESFLNIKEPF